MTNYKKILIPGLVLAIFLLPTFIFAVDVPNQDTGLIPCTEGCGFREFMVLVDNVIDFILWSLAMPLAAIMFAYAGFKLVTSGGSEEARGVAKRVFTNTAVGLLLAAGSWVIVKTLLSIMGYQHIGDFF